MEHNEQKNSLSGLSVEELTNLLMTAKKELMGLNLKKSSGDVKDTSAIAKKKKEIARILTALTKLTANQ